jgi:hypothetical protein
MRIRTRRAWSACVVALALALSSASGAAAQTPGTEDAYLRGYVAAVLEREFGLRGATVDVTRGVVQLGAAELAGTDRAKVVSTIAGIRGVVGVAVTEPAPAAAAPRASAELATGFLKPGRLFDPLLADPRWPHFSAAYQRYLRDRDLRDVAAVSFGETIGLYRFDAPWGGQLETGLQASVFAIFDLDAESHDLINADYFVGLYGAHRIQDLQLLGRVYHQSSHLGDEFLLRSRVQRVNLTYEAVDLTAAYYLLDGFAHSGLEFRSPWTLAGGTIVPVAAADVGHREQNRWQPDLSVRVGFEFQTLQVYGRTFALMLEYFKGHSPNGQFFEREIDYVGLGVHLY